jgi:four helix bundle protein
VRRAAVSIPSNAAEGHGVKQDRWSLRHVSTAIGSSLELETQLEATVRLNYVSRDQAAPLFDTVDRVQKILYGMRRKRLADLGISAG